MTPLHWIPDTHIAIAARPRGGDWLEDELKAWQAAGVTTVVSLLEPDEIRDLDLASEPAVADSLNLQFISFPVPDRSAPARVAEFGNLVQSLNTAATNGDFIAIHCRQGIGRAGLTAAAMLIEQGHTAEEAIATVTQVRKQTVPETSAQIQWLKRFEQSLSPADVT